MALAPELTRARETQAVQPPVPEVEIRGSAPLAGDSEWSVGVGITRRLPQADRVELARAYARIEGEFLPFELRERRRLVAGDERRLWYEYAVQQAREQAAVRAVTMSRPPRPAKTVCVCSAGAVRKGWAAGGSAARSAARATAASEATARTDVAMGRRMRAGAQNRTLVTACQSRPGSSV